MRKLAYIDGSITAPSNTCGEPMFAMDAIELAHDLG